MRRNHGRTLSILSLVLTTCVWGQGAPSEAGDWTGTSEEKILGLATIWAEAKYAFPSFQYLPGLDWDQSFLAFIPRVVAAQDLDEYYLTLMEFAGLLNDGHTGVLPPWGYLRPDFDNPPLEVQIVEDAFLVVRSGETRELEEQGIRVGLEILEIDGIETRAYFENSVNRYYPRGSAQASDAINVVYLLRGPRGSTVTLKVREAGGTVRTVNLSRNSTLPGGGPFLPRILLWMLAESSIDAEYLSHGIRSVRISNFQNPEMADEFLSLIDGLDEDRTTSLLIDLRFSMGGRSDIAETMIGALIDEPVSSPLWKYPHYVAAELNWGKSPEWSTTSKMIPVRDGKRFTGPIVILTTGITSSTAEDFTISLREAGRSLLVGTRTAGSAGNPVSVPLPGGGTFEMATFRAYLPNGDEYVGIGLEPDVESHLTRRDILSGDDAVFDRGIEVLSDWDSYRR